VNEQLIKDMAVAICASGILDDCVQNDILVEK
jgi:hypothetical protein